MVDSLYHNNIYINGYKFVLTCFACPEQYDVYDPEGVQVAYLRVRHGTFKVSCPDCGGDVVYIDYPKGDGIFYDSERLAYLKTSVDKIIEWVLKRKFADVYNSDEYN